ncbi:universal stress protein [Ruficoccus amylovorans]|uniref:Universal stress protein n=1 Tax=Ruficoccus amylovorans TaxID=1804625 RepID=A0A842HJH6_9BACT|nr:universal stress protein [Ruficoccus amylovorans]MBC2596118.1 universal stress protein [Ruficoccus amylovorans]
MKRLLLCTDGSAYSGTACRYAAWVAGRTGARVDMLYVSNLHQYEAPFLMDLGASLGASPYTAVMGQLDEIEKQKAGMIKEYGLKIFADAGVNCPVEFHHEVGILVDAIQDYEEQEAGLVILGKRGENAEAAMEHLGHNMERVVRASKMPCLVTNREYREVKRVVFAYDGGESCLKALEWMAQSKLLKGLELHLISVGEGHGKGEASGHLAKAEPKLRAAGFDVHAQVLTGNVEDSIEDYVVDVDADLLVMGAYGHSRIRQLLIGSTTSDLLRRCRVPILLFR